MGSSSSRKKKVWERKLPRPPSSTQILREIIVDKLDYLQPKSSEEITCEVVDDWGAVTKRSIIRHLSAMADEKRIHRLWDIDKQVVYLKRGRPRRRFVEKVV